MEKWIFILCSCFLQLPLTAQFQHLDFMGAGHDHQITVTTSSASTATGQKTVDGFPIENQDQLKDASRFLAQATFGADMATIRMTAAMGYEAWLDEQFSLPQPSILQEMMIHGPLYDEVEDPASDFLAKTMFRTSWLTHNLTSPDLLRQRMAFIWSQIMVINDKSDFFEDVGQTLGNYYDMLGGNAFENYQKLLTDVTLSPAMGSFLSHYNNPKADPSQNIHPDENYAREIMQLFSIGLWELNQNGTRKYDANGQFIPTYTNADIKEFAQVFTGLGDGLSDGVFGIHPFESEKVYQIMVTPMKMYEDQHDTSEKHLLNGVVLPAGQSGMEDINQTMAHLVNHPNTAPFISKSLIRFMTTSNPSGSYVSDVAAVFNPSEPNNLQEVVRAILLHPEARECNISETYTFGKLREPMVRYMNFLKAFQLQPNDSGDFLSEMFCLETNTGQVPLAAPSVFNYFLPEYTPQGPIGQNYMVAPEFQILNSTNAIGVVNEADLRTVKRTYIEDICLFEEEPDGGSEYEMYYPEVMSLTSDPTALIDYLDILLANGLLESDTKAIINDAVSQLNDADERLQMALYLILISPDYAILK
ncbi:MAG: DUF1800 family protein [Bacteroidota bacterium]